MVLIMSIQFVQVCEKIESAWILQDLAKLDNQQKAPECPSILTKDPYWKYHNKYVFLSSYY